MKGGGLVSDRACKRSQRNELSDTVASDRSQKSSTQIKSESVALADLTLSQSTVGGGFPQLTSH